MKYIMKRTPLFVFLLLLSFLTRAQDFTGQWKGSFIDKSTRYLNWGGDECDYVIDLDCRGTDVTGYSYTYFSDAGKKYYTICRLEGKINRASKTIEITEVERTKTNVPVNIRNCFQVHRLTYFKKDDVQTLQGQWDPAPNQSGDCGYGTSILTRRVLQKNNTIARALDKPKKTAVIPPVKKAAPPLVKKSAPAQPPVTAKSKTPATLIAKKPAAKPQTKAIAKNDNPSVKAPDLTPKKNTEPVTDKKMPDPVITKAEPGQKSDLLLSFEKRDARLMKTIDIENEVFKVDLYDNGEIDGDSISLFFNGQLILAHKRLSEKAISLNLNVDNDKIMNELIMYADNLGSIPPNTALMVVTDGDKRYEVRISSDLENSGVIRFIHKPKPSQ